MPELSVEQIVDIIDTLQRPGLKVALEHCARKRHRLSTCRRCIEACPAGAITWEEGLEIDWEACTGCGICAAVCPTAALEAGEPSDDELLIRVQRAVEQQGWVAFACPRAQEDSQGGGACLTVGCLGRLNEGLLVGAASAGALSLWLVDGACEGCPQAVGRDVAGAVLARSNALLEAMGLPLRAAFRPDLPERAAVDRGDNGSADGVSRRGLIRALARETARVSEVAADVVQKSPGSEPRGMLRGDLPKALPSDRLLLLAALKRLGSPAANARVGEEGGPFARFQLRDGCTGCQMCAFFCPTGALTRVVDDGRIGLAFRASHCTNCGLCQDICYRDAVLLTPQADLNKVATLAVEWCFAQEMDAEPWKKGMGEGVARQILGALGR
jgi:ferredoxin